MRHYPNNSKLSDNVTKVIRNLKFFSPLNIEKAESLKNAAYNVINI